MPPHSETSNNTNSALYHYQTGLNFQSSPYLSPTLGSTPNQFNMSSHAASTVYGAISVPHHTTPPAAAPVTNNIGSTSLNPHNHPFNHPSSHQQFHPQSQQLPHSSPPHPQQPQRHHITQNTHSTGGFSPALSSSSTQLQSQVPTSIRITSLPHDTVEQMLFQAQLAENKLREAKEKVDKYKQMIRQQNDTILAQNGVIATHENKIHELISQISTLSNENVENINAKVISQMINTSQSHNSEYYQKLTTSINGIYGQIDKNFQYFNEKSSILDKMEQYCVNSSKIITNTHNTLNSLHVTTQKQGEVLTTINSNTIQLIDATQELMFATKNTHNHPNAQKSDISSLNQLILQMNESSTNQFNTINSFLQKNSPNLGQNYRYEDVISLKNDIFGQISKKNDELIQSIQHTLHNNPQNDLLLQEINNKNNIINTLLSDNSNKQTLINSLLQDIADLKKKLLYYEENCQQHQKKTDNDQNVSDHHILLTNINNNIPSIQQVMLSIMSAIEGVDMRLGGLEQVTTCILQNSLKNRKKSLKPQQNTLFDQIDSNSGKNIRPSSPTQFVSNLSSQPNTPQNNVHKNFLDTDQIQDLDEFDDDRIVSELKLLISLLIREYSNINSEKDRFYAKYHEIRAQLHAQETGINERLAKQVEIDLTLEHKEQLLRHEQKQFETHQMLWENGQKSMKRENKGIILNNTDNNKNDNNDNNHGLDDKLDQIINLLRTQHDAIFICEMPENNKNPQNGNENGYENGHYSKKYTNYNIFPEIMSLLHGIVDLSTQSVERYNNLLEITQQKIITTTNDENNDKNTHYLAQFAALCDEKMHKIQLVEKNNENNWITQIGQMQRILTLLQDVVGNMVRNDTLSTQLFTLESHINSNIASTRGNENENFSPPNLPSLPGYLTNDTAEHYYNRLMAKLVEVSMLLTQNDQSTNSHDHILQILDNIATSQRHSHDFISNQLNALDYIENINRVNQKLDNISQETSQIERDMSSKITKIEDIAPNISKTVLSSVKTEITPMLMGLNHQFEQFLGKLSVIELSCASIGQHQDTIHVVSKSDTNLIKNNLISVMNDITELKRVMENYQIPQHTENTGKFVQFTEISSQLSQITSYLQMQSQHKSHPPLPDQSDLLDTIRSTLSSISTIIQTSSNTIEYTSKHLLTSLNTTVISRIANILQEHYTALVSAQKQLYQHYLYDCGAQLDRLDYNMSILINSLPHDPQLLTNNNVDSDNSNSDSPRSCAVSKATNVACSGDQNMIKLISFPKTQNVFQSDQNTRNEQIQTISLPKIRTLPAKFPAEITQFDLTPHDTLIGPHQPLYPSAISTSEPHPENTAPETNNIDHEYDLDDNDNLYGIDTPDIQFNVQAENLIHTSTTQSACTPLTPHSIPPSLPTTIDISTPVKEFHNNATHGNATTNVSAFADISPIKHLFTSTQPHALQNINVHNVLAVQTSPQVRNSQSMKLLSPQNIHAIVQNNNIYNNNNDSTIPDDLANAGEIHNDATDDIDDIGEIDEFDEIDEHPYLTSPSKNHQEQHPDNSFGLFDQNIDCSDQSHRPTDAVGNINAVIDDRLIPQPTVLPQHSNNSSDLVYRNFSYPSDDED